MGSSDLQKCVFIRLNEIRMLLLLPNTQRDAGERLTWDDHVYLSMHDDADRQLCVRPHDNGSTNQHARRYCWWWQNIRLGRWLVILMPRLGWLASVLFGYAHFWWCSKYLLLKAMIGVQPYSPLWSGPK